MRPVSEPALKTHLLNNLNRPLSHEQERPDASLDMRKLMRKLHTVSNLCIPGSVLPHAIPNLRPEKSTSDSLLLC
jgi:hypothetical protein